MTFLMIKYVCKTAMKFQQKQTLSNTSISIFNKTEFEDLKKILKCGNTHIGHYPEQITNLTFEKNQFKKFKKIFYFVKQNMTK